MIDNNPSNRVFPGLIDRKFWLVPVNVAFTLTFHKSGRPGRPTMQLPLGIIPKYGSYLKI